MLATHSSRNDTGRRGNRTARHFGALVLALTLLLPGLQFAGPGGYTHRSAGAADTVGLWDQFEATIGNTKAYADPYSDVTLDVVFTRADGSQVAFWGFYDGGTTWKLRIMPDQIGAWQYRATFSDGQPGSAGTFIVVASDLSGMLSRDPTNPLWFGFSGGGHVLIRSLHVGDRFFAADWPAGSRAAFLDWAQAQGYNTLSIGSHYLNRNAAGRGAGWETPDLWPLDAAEYRELEAILDDLAARRIMVFPFGGFFGRDSGFPRDSANQTRYLRYTLARLGAYWNTMLNVSGPEPTLNGFLTASEIERLGAEIAATDIYSHPLSVHNETGNDRYRDAPWTSFGTLQGPKSTDPKTLSRYLLANHHPAKPLYAHETLWSGNVNQPAYSDTDLRKLAYVINFSAAALNFGDIERYLFVGVQRLPGPLRTPPGASRHRQAGLGFLRDDSVLPHVALPTKRERRLLSGRSWPAVRRLPADQANRRRDPPSRFVFDRMDQRPRDLGYPVRRHVDQRAGLDSAGGGRRLDSPDHRWFRIRRYADRDSDARGDRRLSYAHPGSDGRDDRAPPRRRYLRPGHRADENLRRGIER